MVSCCRGGTFECSESNGYVYLLRLRGGNVVVDGCSVIVVIGMVVVVGGMAVVGGKVVVVGGMVVVVGGKVVVVGGKVVVVLCGVTWTVVGFSVGLWVDWWW